MMKMIFRWAVLFQCKIVSNHAVELTYEEKEETYQARRSSSINPKNLILMKAKTNFQKIVMGLSTTLRPITQKQIKWAIEQCSLKQAVISRKTTYCLECGHGWKEGLNLAILLEHV